MKDVEDFKNDPKLLDELCDLIMERIDENDYETVFIGDEITRKNYVPAVLGFTADGRLIYSVNRLIECFMLFDGMSYEDAEEWFSYNTERSLPYCGEFAPVMCYE